VAPAGVHEETLESFQERPDLLALGTAKGQVDAGEGRDDPRRALRLQELQGPGKTGVLDGRLLEQRARGTPGIQQACGLLGSSLQGRSQEIRR
jgi:hypothetical protein